MSDIGIYPDAGYRYSDIGYRYPDVGYRYRTSDIYIGRPIYIYWKSYIDFGNIGGILS